MLDLELIAAPTADLVTTAELQAQCEIWDDTSQDAKLEAFRATAMGHLDGHAGILGRAICEQTWRLYLERFPACDRIRLPLPPLIEVTSITYLDADGATQTLATSIYEVLAGERAEVVLAYGQAWPVARRRPRAIAVTFKCGFQQADGAWPPKAETLRAAVKIMVAAQYELREDWAQLPGLKALLDPIRVPRT